MAAKPSIPKGTRDFSPVEMAKRNYIFNTIRDVYLSMVSNRLKRLQWKCFPH